MIITSKDNENIKHIRKLKEKKYRDLYDEYIIEGIKFIKEAVMENAEIKTIVICEDCAKSDLIDNKILYEIAKYNCIYVSEKIYSLITDTQTPQGILAVISKNKKTNEINFDEEVIVVLDNLQDPGNIGTIIRTIDSVGLNQVILFNNCGDVYNPKVVRSTMGAIFRVNIIKSEDILETIKTIKKHKIKICATTLENSKKIYDINYKKTAIIIGNEANGVSKEVIDSADEKIKIPMLRKNRKSKCSSCNKYNFI